MQRYKMRGGEDTSEVKVLTLWVLRWIQTLTDEKITTERREVYKREGERQRPEQRKIIPNWIPEKSSFLQLFKHCSNILSL